MAFAADAPNGLSDKGVTILRYVLRIYRPVSSIAHIPFPFAYVPLLGDRES